MFGGPHGRVRVLMFPSGFRGECGGERQRRGEAAHPAA